MLIPTKYMSLDLSVVRIASLILTKIQKLEVVKFDELFNYLVNIVNNEARYVFIPALNFLFLIDRLDYQPSTDTLKYRFSSANR